MKKRYFVKYPSVRAIGLVAVFCTSSLISRLNAQETVGGGTLANPAVGPAPAYGLGGPGAVLVKNWHFGTNGTIKNYTDMSNHFMYRDQFGTINNGGNYGASIVAPDAAHALPGQPIEGVNCPPVRSFGTDSMTTYLQPLNNADPVTPTAHNLGCGSFTANWTVPNGGSLLGMDIVFETRLRYVTPPYFWLSVWTAGNIWYRGAEHDLLESFGYDNGGTFTNYDGLYWHTGSVSGSDAISYSSWSGGMATVGITNFDPTIFHTWTWVYKADNTYAMYMDGIQIQYGNAPYPWTVGAIPGGRPINMSFLYDAGWGHTQIASVNKPLPASAFSGKYYEWAYSRVYFVPPSAVPPAPTNLHVVPDSTSNMLIWDLTANASTFNIYRGTTPGGESATPIATGINALAYTDSGLSNGTKYYYKVAGVNSVGTSAQSNEANATPVTVYVVDDADAACTYVGTWTVATNIIGYYGSAYHVTGTGTGSSATFTPTLPTSGNYEVFMSYPADAGRASNTPVDINHSAGTTTIAVNQRANYNTWISLGVYAFNSGTAGNAKVRNDGANRGVIADAFKWVPITSGGTIPTSPSGLSATATSANQINLAWTDNASDETGFTIQRKTGAGAYAPLTTKATNSTSHIDTTASPGSNYTYQVRADNTNGSSTWSNAASATTPVGSLASVGKPSTASSFIAGTDVAMGNDGTVATRWSASSGTYPQWWKVDLGTNHNLTSVAINWYNPAANPRYYRYRLEVSNDDISYVTAVDKTNNTVMGNTTDIFTATGRYLRVTVTTSSNAGWAGFHECSVYGTDSSLKLWHKYDETSGMTAADSSGNANTGTLQSTPTWTVGQYSGGLRFDGNGSDDKVAVTASATLNNLPASTISFWMRPDNNGENFFGRILQKGSFGLFLTSSNQLTFQVGHATTNLVRTTSTNSVSYNTWTHVVVTWDGSLTASNIHIYLNGVESGYFATTNGVGARVSDSGSNLAIGNTDGLDRTFKGVLDDLRIYNRAMSAAEAVLLP